MKRTSCLTIALGVGLLLIPNLATAIELDELELEEADARTNCRDRIDFGEIYECRVKDEAGIETEAEIVFDDVEDEDGDLFTATLTLAGDPLVVTTGLCSCKARGSLQTPKFGESRDWYCVTGLGVGMAEVLEGKTSGNARKLKRVQLLSVDQAMPSETLRLRMACRK